MNLLLDEMFPPAVARGLRERGHDVVAVNEREALRGLADAELFEVAQQEQRAVVTEDVSDWMPLDAASRRRGSPHHGLLFVLKQSLPRKRSQFVGAMIERLDRYLQAHADATADSRVDWP